VLAACGLILEILNLEKNAACNAKKMDLKNANKSNCRKKMQKKNRNQKHNAKQIEIKEKIYLSPPSNLHWFLPCILHLSNVPPSKLHLLFLLFLHLQFLSLFNLRFAFPSFLQLSCVPLSDLHFPIPFLLALFLYFFQDVNILEQAQFDSTIFDLSVCTSPYSIYT